MSAAVAVAVGDEFANDQHGDGEADCGVAVADLAVGVSTQLPVVREPAVCGFDDPAQPERDRLRSMVAGLAAALDDVIGQAGLDQLSPDLGVVVAAVEMHSLDLVGPAVGGDRVEGGFEQADVVAVGAVDRPAQRDAVTVDANRPLPAEFAPVNRTVAGALTAVGALWIDPSIATSERSRPMMRSNALIASSRSWSNTPAAIHSSRRARSVVSDTLCSRIASMSTHDAPVVRRIRIPQKHSRSAIRGRWQPSG